MKEGWKIAGCVALIGLLGLDVVLQSERAFEAHSSYQPSPSGREVQQPEHRETAYPNEGTANDDGVAQRRVPLLVEVYGAPKTDAEASQDAADREAKSTADWWQKWNGLGTVLVGMLQFFAVAGGVLVYQRQTRIMRQTYLANHRPKMRVKLIWIATPDGLRFHGEVEAGRPITIRLDAVNIGGSPARVTGFNFMTRLLPPGERLPQRPPYNEVIGGPAFRVKRGPTKPGITHTEILTGDVVFTADDVREIRNGAKRLHLFGTIEYWDINDPSGGGQTGFCRVLYFPNAHGPGRLRKAGDPDYEYQD